MVEINWNNEKDGVEVKTDEYHFLICNLPDYGLSWFDANILCDLVNVYIPSVEELQVVSKYLKEINKCFEENNGYTLNNGNFWANSEYNAFINKIVNINDGNVDGRYKDFSEIVRYFEKV